MNFGAIWANPTEFARFSAFLSNLVDFDQKGPILPNSSDFGKIEKMVREWGANGARMGREWGANGAARARFGPFWHFFKKLSKKRKMYQNLTNLYIFGIFVPFLADFEEN